MQIIIEGCDGVGKSTLVESLAEKYGCDILHMTSWGPKTYTSYLHRYDQDGIISDRSFISEKVYSKVFNRPSEISDGHFESLLSYVRLQGYKIVILTCDSFELMRRLMERDDEDLYDADLRYKLEKLQEEYVRIGEKYDIPIIDTTDMYDSEVLKNVLEVLK